MFAGNRLRAIRIKIAISAFLIIALGLTVGVNAVFAAVLAGWDVNTLSSYGPSSLAATVMDPNLTVGGLSRGTGVGTTGTAASRAWGGNAWNVADAATAISGAKYASFTVTANTGYTVAFTSISRFDYRRSSTGASTGVLQYQVGAGAFTDITTLNYSSSSSSGASLPAIDLSGIPALQSVPAGTTVTFRIVNYGASASTGTWYIYDVANSTTSDFVVEGTVTADSTPVNGACGTDNGQILAAPTPTNLCSAGTSTAVTGAGHPWTWDCVGTNGGSTANCSAEIQTYTLVFNSNGNGTLAGITPQTVDYGGTANAVTAYPDSGHIFVNWTGTNGFVTTSANPLTVSNVTASRDITANFSSSVITGACGAANGQQRSTAPVTDLCSAGTASAVSGSGPWSWTCYGNNGGGDANCSASLNTASHYRDFAPLADAQVVKGNPSANSGTGTSMYVASANGGSYLDERVWTAFDLGGRIPPGATITSAKLRLYLYNADDQGDPLPVAVHGSSDDTWTESGITWNNQPVYDTTALVENTLNASDENSWVEFDVTPHVLNRLVSGNRINLMVKAATEGAATWASYVFNTKEFNTGYAPRLRVEYEGGAWPDDKVTIIHVNDFHSRLTTHDLDFPDGTGESPVMEEAGGAAYVTSKIMELKAARPESLVLDAGDISEGNPLGDLRVNGGMVDYLTTLDAQLKTLGGRGLDAVVIGNHDVRDNAMLQNMQSSGLPFIAVNMLNAGAAVPAPSAWPSANPFRPYVIINTTSSGGTPTKVAVLGYLTDDSAILSSTTENVVAVKETRWTSTNADHVKLKDWVDFLRTTEHADVVILLSHIGHRRLNSGDDILLGDGDVSPPDLVVAGHWHTWGKSVWQPANLNYNTAVAEAASYGQYVGEVQLTPQGEYLGSQKHPVKPAEITPNIAVANLVSTLVAEYDALTDKPCILPPAITGRSNPNQSCPLHHVVGYSAVDLKLDKDKWFTLSEFPWSGDNAAGGWIADSTVWKLNQSGITAQLALQSGGGIRRDVKAGPITYLDIYETYPWTDDQIVVVTMTSADLWNYLESHYVGSSLSKGWQVTADDGVITAIAYDADGSGPGAPVALGKSDTSTTWQVAISEYMFLHDDWISESGANFNFQSKPNAHYTQSIRDAVVEYTARFTQSNPMTVEGPRYVLNTELAGGFKAVVTMVADAESEPYFEAVFVRLLEAAPETLARRTSYGLANLVNNDGSINPNHEFAETMLYRSHLGFPDGILKVGDVIEVWGEGGFYAGNPQLVDQETVYEAGREFSVLGHDANLAQPEFYEATADFFDEAHENRLVRFRAIRTGDKTVQDADGVSITVYKEGGYYTVGKLPGVNGDMLDLTGIQTQRTGSTPERRFRLREATVVPSSGSGSGYLPYSAVNAISPNPVAGAPITLTAYANDPATGGSGTLSLAPAADTQVASGYPTANYGSSSNLYVQSSASGYGNERAWLRFNLTGLPDGATVNAARLKLYQWKTSGAALPIAVHGSSDTGWSETAMNWNNQPAFDATALDIRNVSATSTWYTWDLGNYANGKTAVSVVAKPVSESSATAISYAFDAKEYGSNVPTLEVDYTAPATSARVVSVRFFYRYASDGLNWSEWTAAGTDSVATDGWQMEFNFPHGAGQYQFYSIATDNDGNVQPTPVQATAMVSFEPVYQQLALDIMGDGTGMVSFSTGGTCSGDCWQSIVDGTLVTMSATAGEGSVFTGWSGCDSENGADCTVSMYANRGVTATFNQSVSPVPVPAMGLWSLLAAGVALAVAGVTKSGVRED